MYVFVLVFLPHGAVSWSVIFEYGISCSWSIAIWAPAGITSFINSEYTFYSEYGNGYVIWLIETQNVDCHMISLLNAPIILKLLYVF